MEMMDAINFKQEHFSLVSGGNSHCISHFLSGGVFYLGQIQGQSFHASLQKGRCNEALGFTAQ